MKISEAYRLAIEMGMSKDPRPKDEVQKVLDMAKAEYDRITDSERELFDVESLWNPYWDCRFSYGEDTEAERIMWGIDIGTGEVLLADRLREKGTRIDAICAHHPNGASKIPFPRVMDVQVDMFNSFGVPVNVAEDLMRPRTEEVSRAVMGSNYNQAVDAARLLDIPLFNVHSAADNLCQRFLQNLMDSNEPKRLGDILDLLMAEPEYRVAAKSNCRPRIMVGSKDSRCGKILCKMTGGTSLPKTMYKPLADAGVGTVMAMHFPADHYEAAREAHINLVCSEHMPSDSLGVNQICDEWQKHGIEVLPCSGLIRCSRN